MSSPEKDIAQLETLLRQLAREYDLFLCGQQRIPPEKMEKEVQALVGAYASRPLQNSTLSFKYNSLVARYNAQKTVWSRRLREREEGRGPQPRGARPAAGGGGAEGVGQPAHPARGRARAGEYLATEPLREQRYLQQFYEAYRHQRERAGESVAKLTPEGFQKTLADRIAQIKREQRCESVLVRVVSENGRTRIVAKPFRREGGTPGAGE